MPKAEQTVTTKVIPPNDNHGRNIHACSQQPMVPPISSETNSEKDHLVHVKTAARFLGVSTSLVYAYVERKQIPHYRMMGRAIRFRLSELEAWRQTFHVNGGINE